MGYTNNQCKLHWYKYNIRNYFMIKLDLILCISENLSRKILEFLHLLNNHIYKNLLKVSDKFFDYGDIIITTCEYAKLVL